MSICHICGGACGSQKVSDTLELDLTHANLDSVEEQQDFFFVVVVIVVLGFFETGFLSNYGASPGTHSVDQADLRLTEIHLPLLPKCAGD